MTIEITSFGGNCPVQAEGTIDGTPFYFRARGAHWSMSVGEDAIGKEDWYYQEPYGTWPEAGWMDDDVAHAFIAKALALYVASLTPPTTPTAPAEPAPPRAAGPPGRGTDRP